MGIILDDTSTDYTTNVCGLEYYTLWVGVGFLGTLFPFTLTWTVSHRVLLQTSFHTGVSTREKKLVGILKNNLFSIILYFYFKVETSSVI